MPSREVTIEQMRGMIWYLAHELEYEGCGRVEAQVDEALENWRKGNDYRPKAHEKDLFVTNNDDSEYIDTDALRDELLWRVNEYHKSVEVSAREDLIQLARNILEVLSPN